MKARKKRKKRKKRRTMMILNLKQENHQSPSLEESLLSSTSSLKVLLFLYSFLITSDTSKLQLLTGFIKEVTIKLDSFPGKFNFITFPTDKAPRVDWLKNHLLSNGLFFVLSKTFEQASHSVNLFKNLFGKLTEYYIKGYRGVRNTEASHVFKTDTVILQIWGFKKKIEELVKEDSSYWPSGADYEYLCKY